MDLVGDAILYFTITSCIMNAIDGALKDSSL